MSTPDISLANSIQKPSKVFQRFLNDYFLGNPMIRGRREEDLSVWDDLEDRERQIANELIIRNLRIEDEAYISALYYIEDNRIEDILLEIVESTKSLHIKLHSARVLFVKYGFKPYPNLLDKYLTKSGNFTKRDIGYLIQDLDQSLSIELIFRLLQDKNDFVRWQNFDTLISYVGLRKHEFEEMKYYTSEAVYNDKVLFNERIEQLRALVMRHLGI